MPDPVPDPLPDPTGIVDAPAPVPATDAPWPAGTASRTAFRPTPGTAGREDRDDDAGEPADPADAVCAVVPGCGAPVPQEADDAGRRRRYARAVQAKGR